MKRYVISATLIFCSNALAMKPATQNKALFIITKTDNNSVADYSNTSNLEHTLKAMINAHEQTRINNRKCTIAKLLHCTHNRITSKNSLFTIHTKESLELKAKL